MMSVGMHVSRHIDLKSLLKEKSYFLLGPRQTGKSALIREELRPSRVYDLLESETYLVLSREPARLRQELQPSDQLIAIDEIQRLPDLLNEVHSIIETSKIHFLLTGSSARKLRRGGVNLLGGRARTIHLHPLIRAELGAQFDLLKALNYGTLPSIYFSKNPAADLQAYCGNYLQQEIAAEGLARNLPAFSRFLTTAAASSGQLIRYAAVASDAQVARSTVIEYFEILRDTMIGFDVPAFGKTTKRKAIQTAKFYFFDVGVQRALLDAGKIKERSPDFGQALEAYIAHELRSFVDYTGKGSLEYWRSASGFEVDFVLNRKLAIEVKSSAVVAERDLKGLRALREEGLLDRYVCMCREGRRRESDGIEIVPWDLFLTELWQTHFHE